MIPSNPNVALIRKRSPLTPRIGIVLGSGLGAMADEVTDAVAIPYADLQGFPNPGVSSHAGTLVLGCIAGRPVAVLSGREHYFEHGRADVMRPALETLKALGVDSLVLTNAAGSVQNMMAPGSVMMISDHINLGNRNPLIDEPSEARFVGLTRAYDLDLMRLAAEAAEHEGLTLPRGVYMWFSGPSFETPAEIRAAAVLGADVVGMSTVPEVILARFLGLRVIAFSVITNYAAGMTEIELSHEETKAMAPHGGAKLARILLRMIADWPDALAPAHDGRSPA
jgi:purine-nucleoside phosphorylase